MVYDIEGTNVCVKANPAAKKSEPPHRHWTTQRDGQKGCVLFVQ
jgi:hypothetical protein